MLTSLMKVWHWFLNRPSSCFTVEHDALILGFEAAGNSFPAPNPTQYGRRTHSSFKQTKAAHNDQPCRYGRLIWSGPGRGGFILFYAHIDVCHGLNMHHKHVCVSVPIQTNGWRFEPESLEHCLSFNRHLHTDGIINFQFPYYLSPPQTPLWLILVSMPGPVSVIRPQEVPSPLDNSCLPCCLIF